MNCVRRHLSALKGGRLGALCHPARVVTLLISDVPGDDPRDIASGPTVGDRTTCADALAIVDRYRMAVPDAVRRGCVENGESEERQARRPAARAQRDDMITAPQARWRPRPGGARRAACAAHILGDSLEGEARDLGRRRHRAPGSPCAASGGKPACCCPAARPRSPCAARAAAAATSNFCWRWPWRWTAAGVHAIAGDTDGVDGAEEIAGAHRHARHARARAGPGVDPRASLDDNDGHGFFRALGDV